MQACTRARSPRTRPQPWMAPMAGHYQVPAIRYTAPPNKLLKEPFQGDLYNSHSWFTVLDPCGADENWRKTTIGVLPEDVLLEIFDFYRLYATMQSQGRPWQWNRLAHVCQKWRHVISRSPRRLGLQILCESGAPIGSILASWPTLPLVAKFKAGRNSKHIPRNVMVALRRPDRLCEIDLHVTGSMLTSIVKMTQKPCRLLESIRITVEALTRSSESILDGNAFMGGSAPHLKEIKLDGFPLPFPEIQRILLSTHDLVELHLANIPNFSPSDLATGLSTSVQLKRLTVDFHSLPSSPPPSTTRPPRRTTLPSLVSLDFHGASEYLEVFIARVELPALCKIVIRLFNDMLFEIPQFCRFIPCLKALKPPARVIVKHGVDSVGVYFEYGERLSENCFLGTSCRQLDWQLSFVTQILSQLSSHLSSVRSLDIRSAGILPTVEDVDSTQWLELFQQFTHVTDVHVWGELIPGIVQALAAEDMTPEILPELTLLHQYRYSVAKAFVVTRELSGRAISLTSGDEVRHFLLPYYTLAYWV